ncbi:hypothetical protein MMC26_004609 [Xylographa opegraphella]|nr:hypothetical protein [Xylographa opegraphella]
MEAAAVAFTGAAAAAAYFDAKFHIRQDLSNIIRFRAGDRALANAVKERRISCFYLFEANVVKFPEAVAIWSRTGSYTWSQVHQRACQYAKLFLNQGVEPGQIVGLYMQNSPEFLFIWLGLMAIGCAPAMINWNLGADPLVHCVKISKTKLLIVDEDQSCQDRIGSEKPRIESEMGVHVITLSEVLKTEIANSQAARPEDEYRANVTAEFPCALFYTSGTTGLPKAFPFGTGRLYSGGAIWLSVIGGQKPGPDGDRYYVCMPCYHGTCGITTMNCLLSGISVAIAKKFSTSQYWQDVYDSQATFLIYVGEAARYLLAAPVSPLEKQHRVRCMYGNGLRPDVWSKFQERFNVPEVCEFFNSTEGMFGLANHTRNTFKMNAVGHHGLIMRYLFHETYVPVEVDIETNEIVRSPKTGFARRKSYVEGGEILVKLPNKTAFPGYWGSSESTAKKYAHDVFKKGDVYYRTGDALRRTDDGHWIFLDRLGDTYRWKSENVSTAEVAEMLGRYPGIVEANVYGVLVPGYEGRAGCAAIDLAAPIKNAFDWKAFTEYGKTNLPSYAVPVFIRVVDGGVGSMSSHNNKQNKVPLRQEGIDPRLKGTKVAGGERDQVYWLALKAAEYVPFTEQDWDNLVVGKARL